MAKIAIVHWNLMALGGAEAVAVNAIESLQDEHDLTLLTLTRPEWETLNEYFNAAVDPVEVRPPSHPGLMHAAGSIVSRFDGLRESVLCRYAQSISNEFDLIVSTRDECCIDGPSLQYIHFPRYGLSASEMKITDFHDITDSTIKQFAIDAGLLRPYYGLCYRLSGFDRSSYRPTKLLTNSEWTATVLEELYDVRPTVVYPPVDLDGFENVPWTARENGFVCVGRISPDKNVLRTIEVIARLRADGHDVHLHVVGPGSGGEYYRRVEKTAERYDFVHLHGRLPREELKELLCTHRYGIHGKDNEHFGMVVAEFLAAGMIPFVPDSGGQRELVENGTRLRYRSGDDAVEKIGAVLADPSRQTRLKPDPERIRTSFGRGRFQRELRSHVEAVLTRQTE